MKLTDEQLDRLLDATIYSWDVSSRLAGIVDFLDFSEKNLAWQRAREVRRAQAEAEKLEFDEDAHLLSPARSQIVESAELRFDIGLARNVRYAGMVAYVTAIEWCMGLFEGRLAIRVPKKPDDVNKTVHLLAHINLRAGGQWLAEVETLRRVIYIRNCIVHNTGRLRDWKFEHSVREAVGVLPGFSVSNEGFDGPSVHIAPGAVDELAKAALLWVPAMDEVCSRNGTFRSAP